MYARAKRFSGFARILIQILCVADFKSHLFGAEQTKLTLSFFVNERKSGRGR